MTWLALMLAIIVNAEKREIHILAVNDMHAQIEVFPQLAALADSLRTIDPSLLIFSAGDNRTGNPINDKYILPAYPMVALMNQVGFNGSTLGNHEFDVHSLKRLIGLSNFRYICANAFPSDSSGIKLVPTQVFDVEGLKVGVIGCIQLSPAGIPSTHPDNLEGISFKPAEEIIPQYESLSKECDVTILLSHLGYPDDIKMAEIVPMAGSDHRRSYPYPVKGRRGEERRADHPEQEQAAPCDLYHPHRGRRQGSGQES